MLTPAGAGLTWGGFEKLQAGELQLPRFPSQETGGIISKYVFANKDRPD